MSIEPFVSRLEKAIEAHEGWGHLERFGATLKRAPLQREQLKRFLACTSTFFKEIPGGILSLALRVTDDWMERDRFGAVGRGARVLLSAVDEFGLHDPAKGFGQTHHELFVDMAQRWGVTQTELLDPAYVLPEATALADTTRAYYRSRSIGEGLGFHLASERTSDREFHLCMQGFTRFWSAYDLEHAESPTLNFYYIHTLVEPMHGSTSREIIDAYASERAETIDQIAAGASAFMESYGAFWAALDASL